MRRILAVALTGTLLAGCGDGGSAAPTTSPPSTTTPTTQPVDAKPPGGDPEPPPPGIAIGPLFIDGAEPHAVGGGDVVVVLTGSAPTPCHTPRARATVDPGANSVSIEGWSEFPEEAICMQVLQPFETEVEALGLHPGNWIISVNGTSMATITVGGDS